MEVASTCNESLLMQSLLKKTTDKKRRAYLINYFLEQFRTTLYRQTMFAEFELMINRKAENGESLTADALCEMYRGLNKLYYGEDIIIDSELDMEWARILFVGGLFQQALHKETLIAGGSHLRDKYHIVRVAYRLILIGKI